MAGGVLDLEQDHLQLALTPDEGRQRGMERRGNRSREITIRCTVRGVEMQGRAMRRYGFQVVKIPILPGYAYKQLSLVQRDFQALGKQLRHLARGTAFI
jgi:hypothetical protein